MREGTVGRTRGAWRRLAVAAAMAALLAGGVATAAEVGGVKLDDRASVAGQDLVLNGAGVRTRAIFKVYVGSLYLPARATSTSAALAGVPRRVQLNLLRTLTADQLVDALVDGLRDNNPASELDAVRPQVDELVRIMKGFGEVREGSVVTLDFADNATRIEQDGVAKGSVPGEAFNRALMRIWVGDKPVQGDLKKAMLGG